MIENEDIRVENRQKILKKCGDLREMMTYFIILPNSVKKWLNDHDGDYKK